MRIAITHTLSIAPPAGTGNLVFQLLLTPSDGPGQRVERWEIEMDGLENAARFRDGFGNLMHFGNRLRPGGAITISASGIVETIDTNGVLGTPAGEPVPALYRRSTTLTRVPVTLYGKFRAMKGNRIELLHGLMARIGEVLGEEAPQSQSQSQGQSQGEGQSQSQSQSGEGQAGTEPPRSGRARADAALLAHGFIGAARALDIPARYVSGYLLDEEFPSPHAWAEAYVPGLGWVGFDPLLQLCPTEQHVRLSAGLDALSTTPFRAVPAGEGARTHEVSVTPA